MPSQPASTPPRAPDPASIRGRVLGWFEAHGRSLPGRDVQDPWRVLVLEVMSQQTQIDRCLRARDAFCERFPTPESLATASPADAVRAWAGLGYNRRALALRRAAQVTVERHGGRVPSEVGALDDLPGVGAYTARAVAARAFAAAVTPVDVNVRRVLSRLLGTTDAHEIQAYGDALAGREIRRGDGLEVADAAPIDGAHPTAISEAPGRFGEPQGEPAEPSGGLAERPARIADALMDLAAAVCRPRIPRCEECPIRAECRFVRGEPPAIPSPAPASRARRASVERPFPATRRWLRGQILRELRAVPDGAWLALEGGRGSHGHVSVREALSALADEGFLEIDREGRARLSKS